MRSFSLLLPHYHDAIFKHKDMKYINKVCLQSIKEEKLITEDKENYSMKMELQSIAALIIFCFQWFLDKD